MWSLMTVTLVAACLFAIASIIIGRFSANPPPAPRGLARCQQSGSELPANWSDGKAGSQTAIGETTYIPLFFLSRMILSFPRTPADAGGVVGATGKMRRASRPDHDRGTPRAAQHIRLR
jgi:hypothetical protein